MSCPRRMWTGLAIAGLTAIALVTIAIGPPANAAAGRGTNHALLNQCTRQVLGLERGASATPAPGSADPQLISRFAILRQASTALPDVAHLGSALAGAGVRAYDPSATVRLRRFAGSTTEYAVPVTLTRPTLSARCARLPLLAGVGSYLALRALQTGSGPGLCIVGIQRERVMPTGVQLPGRPQPQPRTRLMVAATTCQSTTNLVGYLGALGPVLGSSAAAPRVLAPDGITAITYILADGRRFTAPVVGNLATLPAALAPRGGRQVTSGRLRQQLASRLPTTVTETGPNDNPTVALTRPAALIPDTVKSVAFLKKLVTVSGSQSSSDSSVYVSCSARSHRCVAVIVATTCATQRHCVTTRRIKRYRYVGARPPRGTTHPGVVPTGPILARINHVFTRPRKLSLVLDGPPRRHVAVIETVSCSTRRSGVAGAGPPMRLAVPSRTRVQLPPGPSFRSCDVAALVVGARHGAVHARVVRD